MFFDYTELVRYSRSTIVISSSVVQLRKKLRIYEFTVYTQELVNSNDICDLSIGNL